MQEILSKIRKLLEEQKGDVEVDVITNQLILEINSLRNRELYQRNLNPSGEKDVFVRPRMSGR